LIFGLWAEEAGGGVRDGLDGDRREVDVAGGDRDREIAVAL
jgi:hypothetical protein